MTGKSGDTLLVSDTTDSAGGTIRNMTATKVVKLQSKTITPTSSQQTINPDSGYDGFNQVIVNASSGGGTAMNLPTSTSSSATSGYTSKATISRSTSNQYLNIPPGTLSTGAYYTISATPNGSATAPSSISGTGATVSHSGTTITLNKTVSVTPSVSAGYISAGTAGNSSVSLSATDANFTAANIKSGVSIFGLTGSYEGSGSGNGKNAQIASGVGRVAATSYTAVSGQTLTVAKTGTYDVYWVGYRSSTSGTNGSQLYIGSTAYGSAQTTFNSSYTNVQIVHLSNVSLTANQTITVRARSRGTNYYMYVMDLTIIEA